MSHPPQPIDAKKAEIAFARRSSAFSRFSGLISADSSLLSPGPRPLIDGVAIGVRHCHLMPAQRDGEDVSEAALMIRSRTFWPGLAVNVSGEAGTLPLRRKYG